eukprot:TRINITY_DN880_c0_g1_i1.p1 TRINITY_DN880_c0_g1~~TRINITY_DN880_c0_g1_i1.p1  ORF type:complete len:209 (+),score=25.05 TRINITY_DN880_c0_g1_i1:333-959(+)
MTQGLKDLMKSILPENLESAIEELAGYYEISWGDPTRCDYGTGHEMNFLAFLCCIDLIGLFKPEDYVAVVIKVFNNYITLVRKLQSKYMLEPAGSKGVWILDDYHFLVFYFGSAQLRGHPHLKPSSVLNPDIYSSFDKKFMFISSVKYINQVKKGPFFEHSPILYDVCEKVKTWEKVNEGMMKMYKAEVLCKFPVMQHFKFGSLLTFE